MKLWPSLVAAVCLLAHGSAGRAEAQPLPPPDTDTLPVPASEPVDSTPAAGSTDNWPHLQLHGFASQGGFVSTANEYIGKSSRGSLKFFEAGINVSAQLTDQLRAGMQLTARSVGTVSQDLPRVDWALIDYRWREWLGLRAGVTRIPLGLYNEYVDIDSARTAILMPQGVYPIRNRDALISQIGFAAYGHLAMGPVGELDYQAFLGTLSIPASALELDGATFVSADTKYLTGGQLFWRLPLDGLRIGISYLRTVVNYHLQLSPANTELVVMAGAAPADYGGALRISQRPTSFWVGSVEYVVGDWLFAAEYGRSLNHQETSLPTIIPAFDTDSEHFYGMASYRIASWLELGSYYSVIHADVNDRDGDGPAFEKSYQAFRRDLALSVRLDVNDYWLWKVEGHFIDGVAELQASQNPDPTRYWGLFLLKTTVTF